MLSAGPVEVLVLVGGACLVFSGAGRLGRPFFYVLPVLFYVW